MEREIHHKVVVLGNTNVGKTCLVNRLAKDSYSETEPTIGANFLTKTLDLQTDVKTFDIWDTAGQERFRSLTPMYYRGAVIAIVVFDLTSLESFEGAKKWVRELQGNASTETIIGLLGNKLDLRRAVSQESAAAYATQNGLFYGDVSAKSGENVKEAFIALAKKLPKSSRTAPSESKKLAKKPEAQKSSCC
jgi:small GTP-binding protein